MGVARRSFLPSEIGSKMYIASGTLNRVALNVLLYLVESMVKPY